MTYEQLVDFVQNRMRMSHVYQPVGCVRVITYEQPEQKGDPWVHNDRRMGYRTRVDKVFCSPACKQRDYDRRKRQGIG